MSTWPAALAELLAGPGTDAPGDTSSGPPRERSAEPRAVLVSVAGVRGSAPREPGAKMVVGAERVSGTIGGGQLERKAIEISRALLADRSARATLRRFPLGLSLGQCCGGVAVLAFEPLGPAVPAWLAPLGAALAAGVPIARVARLDAEGPAGAMLVTAAGADGTLGDAALDADALALARADLDGPGAAARVEQRGAARLLVEILRGPDAEIVLFGAGHVGRALVRVLGEAPCRVIWVDSRAHEFPAEIPASVQVVVHEAPERLVAGGPARALWVVATHSHALDFALCEQILARGDARYCGMIGSATKRRRLERHLAAVGFEAGAIAGLTCPIGIDGIGGKSPGAIAIATAAELLRIVETGQGTDALPEHRATAQARGR